MTKNVAASIKAKLKNLAKDRNEAVEFILNKYGIERVLYRLSISEHANDYILKGATLFSIWSDEPHRPTRDIDFLGVCDNDMESVLTSFKEICQIECEDGLEFDIDGFSVEEITEDADYTGVRLRISATLDGARIRIQIDIGFGDKVIPEPEEQEVPTLLDMEKPRLMAYPIYSVLSEKLEAMYSLGELNSRMKDFYDVWNIANTADIDDQLLHDAVIGTFTQRETEFISNPAVLEESFQADRDRLAQWQAYLRKLEATKPEFKEAIDAVRMLVEIVTYKKKEHEDK